MNPVQSFNVHGLSLNICTLQYINTNTRCKEQEVVAISSVEVLDWTVFPSSEDAFVIVHIFAIKIYAFVFYFFKFSISHSFKVGYI